MTRKIRIILLIVAVLLISASLVMDVYAAGNEVKDGEDVIQTIDGKLYIGVGVAFQGPWVSLFNVRYPDNGFEVGVVTFPVEQVSMIYHKGKLDQSQ